jgi:hypothetical protein
MGVTVGEQAKTLTCFALSQNGPILNLAGLRAGGTYALFYYASKPEA